MVCGLYGGFAFLFGANSDRLFDVGAEHLSVANFSGLGRFDDGGHGIRGLGVAHDHFHFYLRQKFNRVFAAAINLGVSLLAAKTFDLADRHSLDPDFSEGFLYLLKFEWLYDGFDFFHFVWGLTDLARQRRRPPWVL